MSTSTNSSYVAPPPSSSRRSPPPLMKPSAPTPGDALPIHGAYGACESTTAEPVVGAGGRTPGAQQTLVPDEETRKAFPGILHSHSALAAVKLAHGPATHRGTEASRYPITKAGPPGTCSP